VIIFHVLFLLEVILKLFLEEIFSSFLFTSSDYFSLFFSGSDCKT